MCYLVCRMWVISHWCVWYDVCEYSEQDWSWGSKCTESMLAKLDTTHIPEFESWVCSLMCVTWCVTCCVWCDVWCVRVQTSSLEEKEQIQWASAWHTWHNSHGLTWVVSVWNDVLLEVMWCDVMWCVMWCEYSEQDWRRGSNSTESVLAKLDTPHTPWLVQWVCSYWCVIWCVWCHIDV